MLEKLSYRLCLFSVIVSVGLVFAGCGGGDDEQAATIPAGGDDAGVAATTPAGGESVGAGQAESLKDIPFTLNEGQPVPPDFRSAYQRRALISVEFSKEGQDPFYPQGLELDSLVGGAVENLQAEYPSVDFFSYDINDPGEAETSEDLQAGEYGTLAAQLGVGYTPFVATLAPRDDEYIIENLYQGYVPETVLNQALFDLSSADVEGNTSDVAVDLGQIELTETGGGIEYFSVLNRSESAVNLEGFSLRVLDQETGQVNPDSDGVLINDPVRIPPGGEVSVGRVPDITDAEGNQVAGTFEGGTELGLAPGDQLAILDSGGAVASTITV